MWETLTYAGRCVNGAAAFRTAQQLLRMLDMELPRDPAFRPQEYPPENWECLSTHEKPKRPTDEWRNERVYPRNGVFFGHNNTWRTVHTKTWMNPENMMMSEGNRRKRPRMGRSHAHETSGRSKSMETESRPVPARLRGTGGECWRIKGFFQGGKMLSNRLWWRVHTSIYKHHGTVHFTSDLYGM